MKNESTVTVAQIDDFDEIVDVRSPAEFAEDRVPGAVSCPVLDNEERARVGTMYVQVSSFEAKKLGAALVARNIARHIEERFAAKGRDWKPLVYCWRGGQRSGALAHVLRQIGWRACSLQGGYRAYRREVLVQLDELPGRFDFSVVCGATGSGKSRLLEALARNGAQVLDLESLAQHRGSLLGDLPGDPQPSQKMFDSRVWNELRCFDPAKPVFVESESRKIGSVQIHGPLLERMRQGRCLLIETPFDERVRFLKDEYRHFFSDPSGLKSKLERLVDLHGHEVIRRWLAWTDQGNWDELVPDLLASHYDPAYRRSTPKNFGQYGEGCPVALDRLDSSTLERVAAELNAASGNAVTLNAVA